jgi:hypothetical protein
MEAFVYCWTDHKTQKLYVGYHKGSIDDGYICSSKPMLEQYDMRKKDFSREIIAQGTADEMRILESKILQSVDAQINEDYYNQHNSNGKFICIKHKEETKIKIGKKNIGTKRSEETKQKMREARKKQVITEDTRKKMSQSAKERANTPEGKKRLQNIAHLGTQKRKENGPITMPESSKKILQKISKDYWNKTTLICPHCNKEGKGPNMYRYHFNNCKNRRDSDFR